MHEAMSAVHFLPLPDNFFFSFLLRSVLTRDNTSLPLRLADYWDSVRDALNRIFTSLVTDRDRLELAGLAIATGNGFHERCATRARDATVAGGASCRA